MNFMCACFMPHCKNLTSVLGLLLIIAIFLALFSFYNIFVFKWSPYNLRFQAVKRLRKGCLAFRQLSFLGKHVFAAEESQIHYDRPRLSEISSRLLPRSVIQADRL